MDKVYCERCELCRDPLTGKTMPMVPGDGPEDADLMLVGMNPGAQEQQRLIPFIGRAGYVLDDALIEAGIQRSECYITNAVKHMLPPKRKNLRKGEIDACRMFLEMEIQHVKPKVIVALGGDAINWFTGIKTVRDQRGRPLQLGEEYGSAILMPTYHPASFLHTGSDPQVMVDDLKSAKALLADDAELDYSDVTIVTSPEGFSGLIEDIKNAQNKVAFDIETTGLCPHCEEITDIVFSAREGAAYIVPIIELRNEEWVQVAPDKVVEQAYDLIRDPDILNISHGGGFDYKFLYGKGIIDYEAMQTWFWDTQYGRHAMIDEHPPMTLEYLVANHTSMAAWDQTKRQIEKKYGKGAVWMMTLEDRADYAGGDADGTWRLYEYEMGKVLEEWGSADFYHEVVRPALPVLVDMMVNGFNVDQDQMWHVRRSYVKQLRVIDDKIMDMLGFDPEDPEVLDKLEVPEPNKAGEKRRFNINSDDQMVPAIEEFLGLEWPRDNKWFMTDKGTRGSARKEVRNAMKERHPHPIWDVWRDRRKLEKMLSNYLTDEDSLYSTHSTSDSPRSIPAKLCPTTGKAHTSLSAHGARTGRRASSDPNLQNPPKRDDEGSEIKASMVRTIFVPSREDYSLVTCDFDSAEIWVAAYLSMDPELLRVIEEGLDLHAMTAARVFGYDYDRFVGLIAEGNRRKDQQKPLPPEMELADQQRTKAKVINFGGILYGGGARKLANDIGTSVQEAQQLLDEVEKVYQIFYEWKDEQVELVKAQGYVETAYGRRRHLSWPQEKKYQGHVEREAGNSPIQGTVADHMLVVMPRVRDSLKAEFEGDIVLDMHDELISEVRTDQAQAWLEAKIEAMTVDIPAFGKPLPVSGEIKKRWKPIE